MCKKQENPFAILLKKTVYNHDMGELAIETNNLAECCADLLSWIHDIQQQNGLLPDTKDDTIKRLRVKIDKAHQLAEIASDWNLSEIEINGKMTNILELIKEFAS